MYLISLSMIGSGGPSWGLGSEAAFFADLDDQSLAEESDRSESKPPVSDTPHVILSDAQLACPMMHGRNNRDRNCCTSSNKRKLTRRISYIFSAPALIFSRGVVVHIPELWAIWNTTVVACILSNLPSLCLSQKSPSPQLGVSSAGSPPAELLPKIYPGLKVSHFPS